MKRLTLEEYDSHQTIGMNYREVEPTQARGAVMACFYGDNPTRDLCTIYEMLIIRRDLIQRAIRELVTSEELALVPDCQVPTFWLTSTWGA